MKHRKSSTIAILAITCLALFSNFSPKASGQGLPAVAYDLPAESHVVFFANVQAFLASPLYVQFAQQHEQEIAKHLAQIMVDTGVNPQTDVDYIVGAGGQKGSGVLIASGRFNLTKIISSATGKGAQTQIDQGITVLTPPHAYGSPKGVALISGVEIAVGDMDSLHAVIVANQSGGNGSSAKLAALLSKLDTLQMFSFAGDTAVIPPNMPPNIPAIPASSILSVYGAMSITTSVAGQVSVIAKDPATAGQLASVVQGFVAIGNLAKDPVLGELVNGLKVNQNGSELDVVINVPLDVLAKLHAAKRMTGYRQIK